MSRMRRQFKAKTVTLPANSYTSTSMDNEGLPLGAVVVPSSWTSGVTVLNFLAATMANEDYRQVYDTSGNAITITVGTDRVIGIEAPDRESLESVQHIKLLAQTSQPDEQVVAFILRS